MKTVKKTNSKVSAAKKRIAQHNRRIAAANKAFEKLKPAERRVAIARDVLAQLATKRLVATPGVWLSGVDADGLFTEKDVKKNPELRDLLKKTKRCEGCLIGGVFMCAVERADKLKLDQLEGVKEYREDKKYDKETYLHDSNAVVTENDAFDYLRKFFSQDQLGMMEAAFEQNEGACHHEAGYNFASYVDDPSTRMRLIMENVIVNKGTFNPDQQPTEVTTWTTPGFMG